MTQLTAPLLQHVSVGAEGSPCGADAHAHREHAVLWGARSATSGIETDGTRHRPAPGQGLFVPAGTPHAAIAADDAPLAALLVRPTAWPEAPARVATVVMNAAVRELLAHLAAADLSPDRRGRAERVCLDLITEEPAHAAPLPLPRDPRIAAVARAILADPADDRSLEDWAFLTSASTRTLARAFRADTGMTFAEWRTSARMAAAVGLLADGVPVGIVARRVGYATPSAFSAAFHRTMGRSPQYDLPRRGTVDPRRAEGSAA